MYFNNPNRNPNPYFVYDSLICQCQDLTCRVPLGSMIISFPSLTIVSANPTIQNPKKQGKADFMFIIFLIISAYTAHPVDSFKSTFLLVRGFSIFSRRREYCPALYRVVFKPELNKEEGSGFLRNLTVGFPRGKTPGQEVFYGRHGQTWQKENDGDKFEFFVITWQLWVLSRNKG